MRINVSTPQEFDDTAGKAPKASTLTYTARYTVVGFALFAIATMIFVLMGGLRWLRPLIAQQRRGRYRKVDDEDLEM